MEPDKNCPQKHHQQLRRNVFFFRSRPRAQHFHAGSLFRLFHFGELILFGQQFVNGFLYLCPPVIFGELRTKKGKAMNGGIRQSTVRSSRWIGGPAVGGAAARSPLAFAPPSFSSSLRSSPTPAFTSRTR